MPKGAREELSAGVGAAREERGGDRRQWQVAPCQSATNSSSAASSISSCPEAERAAAKASLASDTVSSALTPAAVLPPPTAPAASHHPAPLPPLPCSACCRDLVSCRRLLCRPEVVEAQHHPHRSVSCCAQQRVALWAARGDQDECVLPCAGSNSGSTSSRRCPWLRNTVTLPWTCFCRFVDAGPWQPLPPLPSSRASRWRPGTRRCILFRRAAFAACACWVADRFMLCC